MTATLHQRAPAPHELNVGFQWDEHPGAGRALTAEQRAGFDRDGFVVLERVIPPDVLARAVAEIDPAEAELEAFLRTTDDGKVFIARADEITFTVHLVARSPWLAAFVRARLFRDLAHDLVGPDVRMYWDQAVYKKPGTEAPFPWHQDNGYAFVEPQAYLTCWIALTDATLDNGCPLVVPGLHRSGTLHHELTDLGFICLDDVDEPVPVEVPAGSIVVFSTLTPHCTGANRTDETRKSYIVQFAHDGAEVVRRDGHGGETREACTDPARQFPVLVAGEAPPGAPVDWPDPAG